MEIAIVLAVFSTIFLAVYTYYNQAKRNQLVIDNLVISNVLDKVAKEIFVMRKDGESMISDAIQRHGQLQQIIADNGEILKKNQAILRKNALELYNVRESTLWLWDRYNSIIETMDKRADLLQQYPNTVTLKSQIMSDRVEIERFFASVFKVTPSQYRKMNQVVNGKDPNGNLWTGTSSVN